MKAKGRRHDYNVGRQMIKGVEEKVKQNQGKSVKKKCDTED